jgi:predicted GNAT family N-acyltransferase
MKLTIIRLNTFSEQDHIDLGKIWPEYSPDSLAVDDRHCIYAARFNDRLLAAVRVTLSGKDGALDSLRVRDVTRRRGVGKYLLEEVLRAHPEISVWWMSDIAVEDKAVMEAFMLSAGFSACADGWQKR